MPARLQFVLGATVLALIVGMPLVYSSHQHTHARNLRVVQEGILYRCGQLTPAGLERVLHDYQIRTVITLRAARQQGHENPDAWEESFCQARGVKFVRIVPRVWGADEAGEIPAEQAVQEFLQVMDNPAHHPVLVHCMAGIHRTGTMCAIYRIEYQGWSAEQAIAEMQLYGFAPADLHQDIGTYIRRYQPRLKRVSWPK